MPIIVLYYLLFGLNYKQIGVIAAALSISIVLLEVPSGIFADKFGRKNSLLICSLLGLSSMITYYIGDNFWFFFTATCLFGMSMAFFSGAEEALLFDSLLAEKKEKKYKKELGEVHFFANITNAIVLILIPLIYNLNPKYPFLIGIAFYLGSFLIALKMEEAPKKTLEPNPIHYLKELKNSKSLFLLILFGSVSIAFIYSTSEYYQPLLKTIGISVSFFGLIYFLKRILTAIGAKFVHKLEKYLKPFQALILFAAFIALSYLLIYLQFYWLVLGGILLFSLVEGVIKVGIKDDVNRLTSSHNRATILSVMSFIEEIVIAVLALIYGYLADIIGITEVFGIGLLLLIASSITLLLLIRSRKIL